MHRLLHPAAPLAPFRSHAAAAAPPCSPRAPPAPRGARQPPCGVVARASKQDTQVKEAASSQQQKGSKDNGKGKDNGSLIGQDGGIELGPIGMTFGGAEKNGSKERKSSKAKGADRLVSQEGVELGPIGMTFGGVASTSGRDEAAAAGGVHIPSISKMSTEEWRAKYEKDGTVDLWVEEEFNSGSRLIGGRAVHYGDTAGFRTGEGRTAGNVASHKVKIYNHYAEQHLEIDVPEDRYILWEAEDNGLQLPYACRMGCCTACAVRIKSGEMYQPEALGISEELKEQGYGLMCVGYPLTDVELETVSEDEVYDLQFGLSFERMALDPTNPNSVERDDFAIEIANMDE